MSHVCCFCCLAHERKRFPVDPGVDWVGRVLHERLLADRDTRWLREHGAGARPRLTFRQARVQDQARTR
jgi:hypothetical protein